MPKIKRRHHFEQLGEILAGMNKYPQINPLEMLTVKGAFQRGFSMAYLQPLACSMRVMSYGVQDYRKTSRREAE